MTTNVRDLYGSRFLQATDLKTSVTGTIERMETEVFAKPGEASRTKGVLYLKGGKKGVVLNKTNAETLAIAFGEEMTDWAGRRVTIRPETTNFQGKTVPSLRIFPADDGTGNGAVKTPAPTPEDPPPATSLDDYLNDSLPF
jgi:arabinogalactan endo-1,4-beta-galactosidase